MTTKTIAEMTPEELSAAHRQREEMERIDENVEFAQDEPDSDRWAKKYARDVTYLISEIFRLETENQLPSSSPAST